MNKSPSVFESDNSYSYKASEFRRSLDEYPLHDWARVMSEGYEKVEMVISSMIRTGIVGVDLINMFDDYNIRGVQIEQGISNICGGSVEMFLNKIRESSPDFIDQLNCLTMAMTYTHHKAVLGGARKLRETNPNSLLFTPAEARELFTRYPDYFGDFLDCGIGRVFCNYQKTIGDLKLW